jgi:hypothetical protein
VSFEGAGDRARSRGGVLARSLLGGERFLSRSNLEESGERGRAEGR